jgi:hypothetical protein
MNKGLLDALVKELPDKLGDIFGLAPGKRDACTTFSRLLAEGLREFGISADVRPVYVRIANQAAIDYLQGKINLEEARRQDGKIQVFGDIESGQEHQHAVCHIPYWNVIVDLTIEPRLSKLVPSHPYWAKWGEFPWWVRVFEFRNYPLEYRLYEIRPTEVKRAKATIRDIVRVHISQAPMINSAPQTLLQYYEVPPSAF